MGLSRADREYDMRSGDSYSIALNHFLRHILGPCFYVCSDMPAFLNDSFLDYTIYRPSQFDFFVR